MFNGIDTYVQFKADQQHERVKIDEKHKDKNSTNAPIQLIIIGKMIYPVGEKKSKQEH